MPAGPEADEGPDWRRAWNAIRRHATLVIAIIAVGVGASVLVARHWHPVYRASTTIWIASQNEVQGRSAQLGPIRQDQLLQWESWIDLLRSYAILDPVVHDLNLNVTPASPADTALFRSFSSAPDVRAGRYTLDVDPDGKFTLTGRDNTVLDRGAMGDSIGERVGFLWAPARDATRFGHKVRFDVATPRTASEALAQAIEARVDRNGAFLRVDLTGPSPERTAATLNAISARYVQIASDLKRRRLAEFASNLDQQRTESQQNLEKAERELEQFRIRTVGLPSADDGGHGGVTAATDPLVTDG
ncbi:MAG TPA: Wzz/FepE/Etk N-terminal domain-containing protein, partial [Gemmatimonadaceae bacterium]